MNVGANRPLVASTLAYTAITLLIGREVLASLSSTIVGDRGDPILNAGILAWNARNIPWTDRWFDFPAFYPATDTLTFSEHLLGLSVIASPVYWLTGDALITYNVTALATYVLSGVAMFALVWRLTGHAVASFLAGLAYAFAPYRAGHIGHIQLLAAFWAPVALLGLHGYMTTGRRRWLLVFALCWVLQGAANGYLLVFFSVLVGFWVLWFAVGQRRWRDTALIAVAAVTALLPLLPILARYVEAHAEYGFVRGPAEIRSYGADLSAVLCAVPRLPVWGWLDAGVCDGEQQLFPGLTLVGLLTVAALSLARLPALRSRVDRIATILSTVLLVMALVLLGSALGVGLNGRWRWMIGPLRVSASSVVEPLTNGMILLALAAVCSPPAWRAVRRASVPAFYVFMAAVMWAFSWGPAPTLYGEPALERGPYAWLLLVPGVDALRVPSRFWMMTVLCLCVATGVLLAETLRRRHRAFTWSLAVVGACGLVLDGWTTLPAVSPVPSAPRPDLLRGGIALTLPLGAQLDRDVAAQLEAIQGGWFSVNGYSGFEPRHYAVLTAASARAEPGVLTPFLPRGDVNVILYESWPEQDALIDGMPGVQLVGKGNGLRQYRIPKVGTRPPSEPAGERLRIASVSASCLPENAGLVLDGDYSTRWFCGPQLPGHELTANLGAIATVSHVVQALGADASDFPKDLVVETSIDGVGWEKAWNGEARTETLEAMVREPLLPRIVLSFPSRRARYVRSRLMSERDARFWSIAELEVWSGAPESK